MDTKPVSSCQPQLKKSRGDATFRHIVHGAHAGEIPGDPCFVQDAHPVEERLAGFDLLLRHTGVAQSRPVFPGEEPGSFHRDSLGEKDDVSFLHTFLVDQLTPGGGPRHHPYHERSGHGVRYLRVTAAQRYAPWFATLGQFADHRQDLRRGRTRGKEERGKEPTWSSTARGHIVGVHKHRIPGQGVGRQCDGIGGKHQHLRLPHSHGGSVLSHGRTHKERQVGGRDALQRAAQKVRRELAAGQGQAVPHHVHQFRERAYREVRRAGRGRLRRPIGQERRQRSRGLARLDVELVIAHDEHVPGLHRPFGGRMEEAVGSGLERNR